MQNFDQNSPTIHILTNVSESRSIASLKIYNQSDQSGSNACDQSPCQHLCLPKPHNDYTCRCTLGYLLENETECKEDTKNDKVSTYVNVIYPVFISYIIMKDFVEHMQISQSLY